MSSSLRKSIKRPGLVRIDLDKPIVKLVKKNDHRTLGIWVADCAERVLLFLQNNIQKTIALNKLSPRSESEFRLVISTPD